MVSTSHTKIVLAMATLVLAGALAIIATSLNQDEQFTESILTANKVPTTAEVNSEIDKCAKYSPICKEIQQRHKHPDTYWAVKPYKWGNKGQKGVMNELQAFDNAYESSLNSN
eukprot:CAMPEP_0114545782 /NCGR_PEP_ID=MMETSP0114-20121206/3594_1 /TAXON_ID=31324 /ORGANISM="Goniomonas sp, Strain m" /LENGTH=112 /DNA_ID=CAMNT_0001730253 /DNA_START=1 /DNA_END=339 /DNA_ORIENTATION=-